MSATAAAAAEAALNPWSCVTCRRRKVRCDRRAPCSNCAAGSIECHYPPSNRAPRRPHDHAAALKRAEERHRSAELLERIRRLEGILETLNVQVPPEPSGKERSSSGDAPKESTAGIDRSGIYDAETGEPKILAYDTRYGDQQVRSAGVVEEMGSLVIDAEGRGYVTSRFWTEFREEMKYIRATFEGDEDESDEVETSFLASSTPPSRRFTNDPRFLWGHTTDGRDLKDLRPLPSQVPFIWQTYVELVDPFIKILHIPTISKTIREVNSSLNPRSPAMEALMFSICLAAITSLSDEEVMLNFNAKKDDLIAQYRYGTEEALARADFFNNMDISVLQAFTIFLTVVRTEEATRFVWSLTGLLVRLAMTMGLHRDGSYFPEVSPFDVEMRRRLWWHICYADGRSGEDQVAEASITERMFDALPPTNINDTDIDPGMPNPPVARDEPTDLTICLIRKEIWQITRQVQLSMPTLNNCPGQKLDMEQKLELLCEARKNIEQKYLRQLNPEVPLHLFIKTFTPLILAKMELVMYHKFLFPGAADPPSPVERDRLFKLSLEIIDHLRVLEHGPSTKRWRWLFRGYTQWHAVGVILSQLCRRPWGPISERAWASLQRLFNDVPEASKREPLWQPLCELMIKVRKHRNAEGRRLQGDSSTAQEFRSQTKNYIETSDKEKDTGRASIGSHLNNTKVPSPPEATMINSTCQRTTERLSGGLDLGKSPEASPFSASPNTQVNVLTTAPPQATLFSPRQDFISPGGGAPSQPNFGNMGENSIPSWPLTEPLTERTWRGDRNDNDVYMRDVINWQVWDEMIERMGVDMGISSGSGV